MTYRVAYTYIGPSIPGFIQPGDRREMLFITPHAFTVYESRKAWPQARDVLLAEYHAGVWTTIKHSSREETQ